MADLSIPRTPEDLTPEWLTEVLGVDGAIDATTAVGSIETEIIGEGIGFVGLLARLRLRYDTPSDGAPATVIAKCPSPKDGALTIGKLYGLYEREVRFYGELGDRVGIATPHCYYSAMDAEDDRYFLLLEDMTASGRIGDQVVGCSEDEALLAVRELASFHAKWWDSARFEELAWLPRGADLVRAGMQALYPQASAAFIEAFGGLLPSALRAELATLDKRVLAMPELETRPETVIHGDYRLDNMFFGHAGAPYELAVSDWQGPSRSNGAFDLAYFIGGSMDAAGRRQSEQRLIEAYHEALLDGGVRDYTFDELMTDYRRALVVAVAVLIVSGGTLELTNERAVQLAERILEGLVTSITDHDALALLPAAT